MTVDLSTVFTSWDTILVAIQLLLTLIITQISKQNFTWLNTETAKMNFKQITSWVISIGLSFVGNYFGLGIFAGTTVLQTILYGFILGLVSNGVFDISIIKSLFTMFQSKDISAGNALITDDTKTGTIIK